MRRYIITSACTLVMSLIGAFGFNQNSLNLDQTSKANTNSTQVVENVTDIQQESLPSDNQTIAAENAVSDTASTNNEVTPLIETSNTSNTSDVQVATEENVSKVDKTDSNEIQITVINTDQTKSATKVVNTKKKTASKKATATNQKTSKNTKAATPNTSAIKGASVTNSNAATKVITIDASQCDSVQDVITILQNKGYTNITKANIQNIKSLEGILAAIQNNNASKTPDTQTNPTTQPSPTVKPAPTTKPVVTTQPAPTTKPVVTATPAPTAKPTTAPSSGVSNYASEVLRLVNIERAKAGLSAFTTNQTITAAANKRAQETKISFSHTRPNGTSFSTALQEYGVSYRAAGENIAYGQRTPQEVVTGWMNSPGHRANILNANFNKIGIGVYQNSGVIYWSQLFTN